LRFAGGQRRLLYEEAKFFPMICAIAIRVTFDRFDFPRSRVTK